jgi:nucleoside permease NupC
LVTEWGSAVFLALGRCAEGFLAFSYQGSDFVFSSELSATAFIAFRMLPTIVFFSCVSSLLFYLGVVQVIVDVLGPQPRPRLPPSRPYLPPSLSDTLSATHTTISWWSRHTGTGMQHLMATSRIESVCAASNIFLGQVCVCVCECVCMYIYTYMMYDVYIYIYDKHTHIHSRRRHY